MMCSLSQETIKDILHLGKIYEVGGAVRDRLLSIDAPVKDRDYLVTGITYDDLSRLLKKHGRVDLVGRSFGVIKFTQYRAEKSFTFDITLPRKEHSTGSGHRDFAVDFDPDLSVEDDLIRRDFTVNAMALALDSEDIIDPLGGRLDLENKQLRMTSEDSFKEDPLRMLRAVQFAARFGFSIEVTTLESMTRHAASIVTVTPERISEELTKLLTRSESPSAGFRLMQQTGLLKEILPELEDCVGVDQPGGYHKYDVFEHSLRTMDAAQGSLRLRLAALFHDVRKPQTKRPVKDGATFYGHEVVGARTTRQILTRLRVSNDLIKDIETLIERHMFTTEVTDKGLRRLLRRVGPDLIFDLLDLRRADVEAQGMGGTTDDVDRFETDIREELERKPPLSVKDLAIDGHDVMDLLGLDPGPSVGRVMDYLFERVLDDPSRNTRDALIDLAREYDLNKADIENKDSNEESDR
ncbi:MAG: HD domain-containing protein [Candidatus Zixiibacteriota bacterium]|nr:MAG: HD domain-containing protein [candidate division Zixibacteria bacterium]